MTRHRWFPLLLLCILALPAAAQEPLAVARPAYREVTLTGFTRARATLPLVAESSGKVMAVNADVGDTIVAPGVFARIDPTFIRLDLEANRIQQRQLRDRVAYDSRETERYRKLRKTGSASVSHLDQLEQNLRDNRHQLQELAVQEKVLEERLARTRVPAPVGWRVAERRVEPGQRVNTGEVLGEVGDFTTLLVPFALTPEQFAALDRQEGALVLTFIDWGSEVPARIHRVSPGFDATTRKVDLDLALEGKLPEQRGGLRVSLTLSLPERSGAVLLPPAAVEESYEEYWVTREDGERIRVVRLGNQTDAEGDLLRVSSPRIEPGQRFRILRGE